ncbi:MAG: type VI secretion system baseplate subunit TssF, partial [Bacteroidota bacterium]
MRRRYFEEEMRYLHEAGKAFAEAHPDVGRYLDVDSISDRDPYVERLFEGVAFLTGRIRALLDDELPQYTEGLLSLLYPHFLRPLPAFSIVEMRPKVGMLQETKVLDPGAEVISAPVGSDYMRCRFQSAYPVHLHPMTLAEAALDWRPDQTSSLRLRFDLERGVDITNLDLSRLRLYFHADMQTAQTLHLFATRHVREVVVQAPGGNTVYGRLRGQKWVQPVGFGDQESLLPRTQHEFSGYRLLQEYLCFPSKFLFVDLLGLEAMDLEGQSQFEVLLSFDASYPENQPVSHTNVRLHCTPVVNLYETDAEPFRADGLSSEYRLLPSVRHRSSTEIYDIRSVIGMEEVTGRRNTYEPYFTFKHATQGTPERYYTVHRRTDPQGRPALYLSLHAPSDSDRPGRSKRGRGLMAETISTEVWATNGNLPHEKIQEGMINQVGPNLPQII